MCVLCLNKAEKKIGGNVTAAQTRTDGVGDAASCEKGGEKLLTCHNERATLSAAAAAAAASSSESDEGVVTLRTAVIS